MRSPLWVPEGGHRGGKNEKCSGMLGYCGFLLCDLKSAEPFVMHK